MLSLLVSLLALGCASHAFAARQRLARAPRHPLARRHPHKPQVCERFEAYACGVEIANAFGELTDAAEQRTRLESEMAQRRANGQEDYPLDEDFLAALAAMPEASGIALGADRVLMLASGAGSIEATMWTPLAG
jgi:lysyl-tRNA synthetase class 2